MITVGTEAQKRENFLGSPDHDVEVMERPGGNCSVLETQGVRRAFTIVVALLGVGSLEGFRSSFRLVT